MSSVDPLIYTFTVDCQPGHAFETWTSKIDRWWPKQHSLSGDPSPAIAIEGFVGGRIVERDQHGVEYEWGRVTDWEPPDRLAFVWYAGSTPEKPTAVELTFGEDNGKTTVQLISSGWERFDDGGQMRGGNDQGWGAAVDAYRALVDNAAV